MKRYASLALLAGITASITFAPAVAHADLPVTPACSELRDTVGNQYSVRLCDVTDVDQFRETLAGKGYTHCGPTSLYNALYYLNEHKGIPARVTANGYDITEYDPSDPADYHQVSAWVGWLGAQAGMGPKPDGSSAKENRAAFDAATATAKSYGYHVASGGVGANSTPEFGLAIAQRLANAPVQLWYGRYKDNGDGTLTRTGGHAVTVVSAKGSLASGRVDLALADPGRAADHDQPGFLDTQSSTRYETVTLVKKTITEKVVPEAPARPYTQVRTYWHVEGERYGGTTGTGYAEAFNWFEGAPPVG